MSQRLSLKSQSRPSATIALFFVVSLSAAE
jgi:hypothetical protein